MMSGRIGKTRKIGRKKRRKKVMMVMMVMVMVMVMVIVMKNSRTKKIQVRLLLQWATTPHLRVVALC